MTVQGRLGRAGCWSLCCLIAVGALVAAAACSSSKQPPGGAADGGVPDAPGDTGCACTTPAPPRCLDDRTLETTRAPGACVDDVCMLERTTTPCPFGCADGACQPEVCTPSCPAATCGDDGCGGRCGACDSGTTLPGIEPVELGTGANLAVSADGIHAAMIRSFDPACGLSFPLTGKMAVWTVPTSGAPSHRTIGAHVVRFSMKFTAAGDLVYLERPDPCGNGLSELWIARGDGGEPHRLATGVLTLTVAGDTAVYDSLDGGDVMSVHAVRLSDGRHLELASFDDTNGVVIEPSPDGSAVWAFTFRSTSSLFGELWLLQTDASARLGLYLAGEAMIGVPHWAPDSRHLVFARSGALEVIDRDGSHRSTVVEHPIGIASLTLAFSASGSRLAVLDAPSFSIDVVVRTFDGRPDVRITNVVPPNQGRSVTRLGFSTDGSHVYAATTNGDISRPVNDLMTGVTAVDGDAKVFVPGGATWTENRDGSVIAVGTSRTTQVVTFGGGSNTIPGFPFGGPAFEPVAVAPRLLVPSIIGPDALIALYPTSGAGPGIPLPDPMFTFDLESWQLSGQIPFVLGWAGSLALYPADVFGMASQQVDFDLMGWTPSGGAGRVLASTSRFQLADATSRIFATTDIGRFYVIARP